jgi:hypothetical protein
MMPLPPKRLAANQSSNLNMSSGLAQQQVLEHPLAHLSSSEGSHELHSSLPTVRDSSISDSFKYHKHSNPEIFGISKSFNAETNAEESAIDPAASIISNDSLVTKPVNIPTDPGIIKTIHGARELAWLEYAKVHNERLLLLTRELRDLFNSSNHTSAVNTQQTTSLPGISKFLTRFQLYSLYF